MKTTIPTDASGAEHRLLLTTAPQGVVFVCVCGWMWKCLCDICRCIINVLLMNCYRNATIILTHKIQNVLPKTRSQGWRVWAFINHISDIHYHTLHLPFCFFFSQMIKLFSSISHIFTLPFSHQLNPVPLSVSKLSLLPFIL